MEAKRGKVITFYSYKGGTGRSMALANTAYLLARRSDVRRVLAIDWDLEAPGLHHYLSSVSTGSIRDLGQGVIELFCDIAKKIKDDGRGETVSEDRTEELLNAIALNEFIVQTKIKKVDLLPVGRIDTDYAERVAKFDWRGLFEAAPSLIRVFAERLAQHYDYVLVDSRTGLNDISGICTALLPDQLVFVFTPNNQSIDGGIDVLEKTANYRRKSDDLRPLVIFPLQSRIEMSEPQLFASWRFGSESPNDQRVGYQQRFESLFTDTYGLPQCDLKDYFDEVQIQYVPRYSFGEELAVITEQGQGARLSLSRSYAAFADVLASQKVPWNVKASTGGGAELVTGVKPTLVKVSAAKEYVTEERLRVKLYDLVADEVRQALQNIRRMSYQGQWSVEEFEQRLQTYESICNDLLHIETVLAFWGERTHENVLMLAPKRLIANLSPESGLPRFLAMRLYPAMLLTYAAGVACVAAGKYQALQTLLSIPATDGHESEDLLRALGNTSRDLHEAFQALPEYSRHHTPRSDYLHGILQPVFDKVLFVGSDYDDVFDRFEILLTLEYAHRSFQKPSRMVWGPPGRFAWRRRGDQDQFKQLLAEAEAKGSNWELLKAGFFGGTIESFNAKREVFADLIDRFNPY